MTMSLATACMVFMSFPSLPLGMASHDDVIRLTFASCSKSAWLESLEGLEGPQKGHRRARRAYAGRLGPDGRLAPGDDESPCALGILFAVDVPELLLREVIQELSLPRIVQEPESHAGTRLHRADTYTHPSVVGTSPVTGTPTWLV